MINFALASLAFFSPSVDSTLAEAPPLKIWISDNRAFRPGNAVKVQVETGKSGYLLVLHFSPSGQLSVLFPVSPADDNMVQAERRYEVRDGDGSVSFVASGSGPGLIYSALSEDPWQLESVNLNGAWDYGALTIARDTKDPEADITALVQKLSSPRGFDYDVLDYAVYGDRGPDASPAPSWWSPAYNDNYYDCGCGGVYGSSIYIGFGFNWGYGGWPWYWGFYPYATPYSYYGYYPGYYPYYYPYHGHGYYPGYGHGGYYNTYNKIVGRPRGYQVNPHGPTPNGRTRAGSRSVVTAGEGVFADGNGPARRARGGDRAGTRSGDRDATSGGSGRPASNDGNRSNNAGNRADGNPRNTGGDHGDRARARPSGRSGYSTAMTRPNVEQARPASRSRGEWVRVEDATPNAPARRAEGATRISSNVPTRVDVPEARRMYRPEAPRTREAFAARPSTEGQARQSEGGQARARGNEARPSGGNRSVNQPSYAAPRGESRGGGSQPRMSGGGGGGGSRGSFHGGGGGGGRARGGRP